MYVTYMLLEGLVILTVKYPIKVSLHRKRPEGWMQLVTLKPCMICCGLPQPKDYRPGRERCNKGAEIETKDACKEIFILMKWP